MSDTKIIIKKSKEDGLKKFLINRKVDKGLSYTHTSLYDKKKGGWAGSFNINENDIELFNKLYHEAVFINNETWHLTEKHKDLGPILLDIDFKYNDGIVERQYNDELITKLLLKIMFEIEKYINIIEDFEREAFIFEKKNPYNYKDNLYKDGIHIIFPYLITKPNLQYLIRENLLNTCKELFSSLPFSNDINDIIDESIIERNC